MPDYFTHKHTTGTSLPKHGQHIDSISLRGAGYRIGFIQLPATIIKLNSTQLENCKLQLDKLVLQLQQGEGNQGVLGAAATPPLKQLRLADCLLLDGEEGLASALTLLPGLEHLGISNSYNTLGQLKVPLSDMLPGLQELTYLELGNVSMQGWFGDPANLQQLSGLTRLADLRLLGLQTDNHITASTLSGAQSLTHLQLQGIRQVGTYFDPAALEGKTLLQHLELQSCRTQEGQMLSQLQHLQHLTCFDLGADLVPHRSLPLGLRLLRPDGQQQAAAPGSDHTSANSCLAAYFPCWQAVAAPAVTACGRSEHAAAKGTSEGSGTATTAAAATHCAVLLLLDA